MSYRSVRSGLQPREYDPALFVNRERELELVARRMNLARAGGLSDNIVNFWGIRGTGKSWLMRHVERQYRFQASMSGSFARQPFSLLFPFGDATGPALLAQLATHFAREMLSQLAQALPDEERGMLQSAADRGDLTLLVQAVRILLTQFVPVILLDNSELLSDEDWQHIEQGFIEPLVITNRVLFVISGRDRITDWHRFETRRRVKRSQETMLQPFDKQTALIQIERGGYQMPIGLETFYAYTAGSPLLLDKFAHEIAGWKVTAKNNRAQYEALGRHQRDLLALLHLSELDIIGRATNWLPLLNVLSPLRFFRLEAVRYMMQEVDPTEHPDTYYLGMLRDLDRNADFIWWDRERRAYVASPIVRRVMNRRHCLDESRRERYVGQHRRAFGMYRQWIKQFPRTCEDYLSELWFHLASIHLAIQDQAQLQQSIQSTLALLDMLRPAGLHALQQQFEADRELHDLLPDAQSDLIRRSLAGRQ
jgi:hypothetical protein